MRMLRMLFGVLVVLILITRCEAKEKAGIIDRENKIPKDRIKMTPEMDKHPPILKSDEFEKPVPLPYPINTAGVEDSPFIPADSDDLYLWFTPDIKVPPEKQLLDGVTGIYQAKKIDGKWAKPERVMLQDPKKLALDGCTFVLGNTMWFGSTREGYKGLCWFTAQYKNAKWANWKNSDFDPKYQVGELHISADGNELYFHSARSGGKGKNDLWVSKKENGKWQEPKNIEIVNSEEDEGMPYLTPDGNELWFNRPYFGAPAVFRSKKADGQWQTPEVIAGQICGEPTLDKDGNLYFVHFYYNDKELVESDIYVAYKKK